MRVVQLHYRRVATALGIGFVCTLYIVGRFAIQQQYDTEPHWQGQSDVATTDKSIFDGWFKPADAEIDAPPTDRPGYRIVGSNSSVEFLDLVLPVNNTYAEPKTLCSIDSAFNQNNLNGCPDFNCKMLQGAGCANSADAVIFNMGVRSVVGDARNPKQYYVFMSQESPMHSGSAQPYAGFFNLSMGYRRDADIPCPYGYVIQDKTPDLPAKNDWTAMLKTKTKPFAWFVSNCHAPSRRMEYVERLRQHLQVDIFGGCGNMSCPKPMTNCMKMLNTEYRFYLALENSVCKGYITEKLWSQGLQAYLVPIVISRKIVERYLPKNSFIALDDFDTVESFAAYIRMLMTDDGEYTKLALKWRETYRVVFLDGTRHDIMERPWGFCRLCQLVQQQPRPHRVIENLFDWWVNDAHCDAGQTINDILSKSRS